MVDQEKLAMEALEEIGGGGIIDKIQNMSAAKKAALGAGILALIGVGTHEAYTKGAWTKAAWDKAKSLLPSTEPTADVEPASTEGNATVEPEAPAAAAATTKPRTRKRTPAQKRYGLRDRTEDGRAVTAKMLNAGEE